MKLRLLDLFSGIGGFSLGLERSGAFETVAFCEVDPFCQRVLKKHWPKVPCYDDIRQLSASRLSADGIGIDAICGGFPCQDISVAGKGAGLAGERSGLWQEYARLVGQLRPRFIIVENVAALLGRGIANVLGDLAALGYDAEWEIISASSIGAPHQRDRIWIVAYPNGLRKLQPEGSLEDEREWSSNSREDAANAYGAQRQRGVLSSRIYQEHANFSGSSWWSVEPDVGRVAHGVPARTHRLRALGNAVVPQIPELIGFAIAKSMEH